MAQDRRSFNQAIAAENTRLFAEGYYETRGVRHDFSPRIREIIPIPAESQPALIQQAAAALTGEEAKISVKNGDTFSYAEEAVLNFASDWQPGGAYLYGGSAQEACLCRQSTLYASLTAPEAALLYEENQRRRFPLASDTFLFSPYVEIFRASPEKDYALRKHPRVTSVLTVPAPDMRGEARHLPLEEVRRVMRRRMKAFLAAAWLHHCQSITLGAWGCGVFAHDAKNVAEDFYTVLVSEKWQSLFSAIVFAVYGDDDKGRYNRDAFRERFGK